MNSKTTKKILFNISSSKKKLFQIFSEASISSIKILDKLKKKNKKLDKMKKIIDFLKSKKIFSIPKQREILFFDSLNLKLFLPYLKVNGFEILETRKKLINVYVIMKLLCKGKKVDGVNYFLEYIKIVNPKIIISFTDNSIFLYRIKNFFPKIKILVVQNGMRNNIFFNTLKADKTLKSDVIFTWGKKYYRKI